MEVSVTFDTNDVEVEIGKFVCLSYIKKMQTECSINEKVRERLIKGSDDHM
jgi:hypothetical protein